MSVELDRMIARFAVSGRVTWIGVRPGRREPMRSLDRVAVRLQGLEGDRRTAPGKRAVTLIQAEHLPAIAAFAGLETVAPEALRRNLVVAGLNLLALRKATFRIGTATLRGTGPCAPCTRMEEALGHGGFNAMRGHGGITAEVVEEGEIALGDTVATLPA